MAEEVVQAPMMANVLRVHVKDGTPVKQGDRLCDIEALKMEIPILAPVDGTIKAIHVTPGQKVEGGDPLIVIEQ